MPAELVIAPEAEQDIVETYIWYEDRLTGLGEEFLRCVEACLDAMCRTPASHAVVHDHYRRGLMRRFP